MNRGVASLKARIRNIAKAKNVSAQALLQNYMFENFLYRLSRSEYKDKFIIKGGILITAIVGMDSRSTMDLDATLRKLELTEANIRTAIKTICSVPAEDGVVFQINSVRQIRRDDIYGGYRVGLSAIFETIKTPLTIDISVGDAVTPKPVKLSLTGLFDDKKKIDLWAYNIETILAEKLETILSRNILNSRPRDFYDIYILTTTQTYKPELFAEAFAATSAHRGTSDNISDMETILSSIAGSNALQDMWAKYGRQFSYASGLSWDVVVKSVEDLCKTIHRKM